MESTFRKTVMEAARGSWPTRPSVGREGHAQVEHEQSSEPLAVLDVQRLVEVVHGPQALLHLGCHSGVHLRLEVRRRARREVHDGKTDDRDPEKEGIMKRKRLAT